MGDSLRCRSAIDHNEYDRLVSWVTSARLSGKWLVGVIVYIQVKSSAGSSCFVVIHKILKVGWQSEVRACD